MPTSRFDERSARTPPPDGASDSRGPVPAPGESRQDRTDFLAQALRSGSPAILHVRGNSMLPTLREGTRVRVLPVPAARIGIGRIALFQKDDLLVVHRLVWKRHRDGAVVYLFKGDNSGVVERVAAAQILGMVEAVETSGAGSDPASPRFRPARRDRAYFFYHLSFLFLGPLLRFAGILTGGSLRLPRGRLRSLLKGCHSGIESVLFRHRRLS